MNAKRCDICKSFYLMEQDSERAVYRNKKIFGIALFEYDCTICATFDLCNKCSVKIAEFVHSGGIKI